MSLPSLAQVAKLVAVVTGFLTQVIALGVLDGTPLHFVQGVLAVLTAAAVYLVPNASPNVVGDSARESDGSVTAELIEPAGSVADEKGDSPSA